LSSKAIEHILRVHKAQLTSYLRLSGHPAGLLLNFNVASMREGIVRVLNDRRRSIQLINEADPGRAT
jgi:GxxExxY protein